ncbi:MAG: hypothetical protein ACJAZI_001017 [Cycloclasticus sp.]|jgi:hypothetical protein
MNRNFSGWSSFIPLLISVINHVSNASLTQLNADDAFVVRLLNLRQRWDYSLRRAFARNSIDAARLVD